jgi:hypothetical protein
VQCVTMLCSLSWLHAFYFRYRKFMITHLCRATLQVRTKRVSVLVGAPPAPATAQALLCLVSPGRLSMNQ